MPHHVVIANDSLCRNITIGKESAHSFVTTADANGVIDSACDPKEILHIICMGYIRHFVTVPQGYFLPVQFFSPTVLRIGDKFTSIPLSVLVLIFRKGDGFIKCHSAVVFYR